uniref:RNA-directed DNA polymerase, eukaryota, reverse transcriptase zinc-binding domain protein n=1 Tax=Tanacetum cinerariifolium TaxID=118510 RepID=A0A6L2LNN3_TANCI|nr:RNA-directed DNA polymerase, eukaryota, reverse transcriptase zinc-binding domain protein [Tanacetum cinerariifolium]
MGCMETWMGFDIGKWWWRFKKDGGGLWVRVIKSIHGMEEIDGVGIEFTSSCVGEVGEGRDIRFWVDRWVDNRRLYDRFPRLFHLDSRKEGSIMDKLKWVNNGWVGAWDWSRNISGRVCREYDDLIEALRNVAISNSCKDRWRWTLGEDGDFKVKILASLIEEKILQVENGGHDTHWNNLVPKKVNVFV